MGYTHYRIVHADLWLLSKEWSRYSHRGLRDWSVARAGYA